MLNALKFQIKCENNKMITNKLKFQKWKTRNQRCKKESSTTHFKKITIFQEIIKHETTQVYFWEVCHETDI